MDHKEIFLEPLSDDPDAYGAEGRLWCKDDVWDADDYDGIGPTKYIRKDLYDAERARREDLEAEIRVLDIHFGGLY